MCVCVLGRGGGFSLLPQCSKSKDKQFDVQRKRLESFSFLKPATQTLHFLFFKGGKHNLAREEKEGQKVKIVEGEE